MNLSINLDDYLSSYDSFRICSELLEEYFKKKSPFEDSYGVYDDKDGDSFYYKTNGSQEYYKRLLQENYSTLYQLIALHITRPGEELSWHDWYIVASNAYKMKGNIGSLKYVLQHFGDGPLTGAKGLYKTEGSSSYYETDLKEGEAANIDYTISRVNGIDVYNIAITLDVSTKNVDLSKYLLTDLARELLIVEDSDTTFDKQTFVCSIVFKENVTYSVDFQINHVIDLKDCGVLGKTIKLQEFDPIAEETGVYTYGYSNDEAFEIKYNDEDREYYAYMNIAVPLFTWYALGKLHINLPYTRVSYAVQVDLSLDPIIEPSSFYYKAYEKIGFNLPVTTDVSVSDSIYETPILNNTTDLTIDSSDNSYSEFVTEKVWRHGGPQ